ncbi:MAG: SdpI family protein [Ferruginibacter sp.]|nr:SdpI family protein [Ferruginibacter sp.]
MKKNMTELIIWIVLGIPFIAAFIFWDKLPDRMAIHFNFSGDADGFGNKLPGILMLPVINLLVWLLLKFLPKFMMTQQQFDLFSKRYNIIRLLVHSFITALYLVILMYTLQYNTNVLLFIAYGISILLLVTGNYLNNIKPNNFIGIKTPWTLKNADVWRKTHHFTSRLWVAASLIIMCIIPFVSQLLLAKLLIAYFIIITIPPFIYSYIISKKTITP